MTAEMYLPQFLLKQKLTLMVNRYEIYTLGPDGKPAELMAFAEQKRMAFKEQVTFYTDASKTRPVFGFKARKVMDLGSGYDITDEAGQPIGFFRKDFGASLLRSTFHLEGPGYTGTGQERSMFVALLRRFTDVPFLPIHFDFTNAEGAPMLSSTRRASVGDRYTVTVPDQRVDFRVAAAVAVALDALMAR
ncbi:hypothetical protein GCM10011584_14040 [Nocardioides phosphati]|uniref:Uncharacterized protein n=1 Tax=Nocardioides phosphati TaxID=1867775 RepID=A0ABQ2N968_9ACTN|nr:hypothetical protein [Nocardioides phosphati]GGO88022.1 hypothetical protein GCM10011584_14040 [Nocardioides phosphati]